MDGRTNGRTDGQDDSYIPPKLCLRRVYKIAEFGQREVISFFTLVTNKGEHSIIYSQ